MSATVHTLTLTDELIPLDDVGTVDAVVLDADPPDAEQGDGPSREAPHQRPVSVEVVARERVAALGTQAWDAEAGEWVAVTPEMVGQERQLRDAFALGKLMQAVVMREIVDGKFYLASGCETITEYAEERLGVSKSTAYDLYRVGSKYASFLPAGEIGGGFQTLGIGAGVQTSGIEGLAESVQGTSFSNLLELTRLGDDLDTLLDGSALTLADGRTVSLDSLKRASAKEAKETIAALKREYRGKLQRDQERADLAEAERDVYRERLDTTDATIRTLRDGERLWGPRQLHAEGQIALMESIEQHLKAVGIAADQIHPDDDVPDAVARAAGSMLHRFETHLHNLRDRLAPLTARL